MKKQPNKQRGDEKEGNHMLNQEPSKTPTSKTATGIVEKLTQKVGHFKMCRCSSLNMYRFRFV